MESGSTRPPDPSGSTANRIDQVIETAEQAATEIKAAAEAQAQRELDAVRSEADTMTRERVAMVSELTEALLEHATLIATQCENLVLALEGTMRRLGPAAQDALLEAPGPASGQIGEAPAAPIVPRTRTWPPPDPFPSARSGGEDVPGNEVPADAQTDDELEPTADLADTPRAESPPPDVLDASPAAAQRSADDTASGLGSSDEPGGWSTPAADSPGGAIPDEAYLAATRLALSGRDRSDIADELSREFGIEDPEPVLDRVLGAD